MIHQFEPYAMTANQTQPDITLVIFSILMLMTSIILFVFAFYMVPFLAWSWQYDVPAFIFQWEEWLKKSLFMSDFSVKWAIFAIFFVPALVTGVIAEVLSIKIDKTAALEDEEANKSTSEDVKQTLSFSLKLLVLMGLVVGGVFFIEWLLTNPNIELGA